MGRRNLEVRSGVQVHRLVFEGRRCIGVEIVIQARREVIVSGGTYHSPHLLMLSGIGPPRTWPTTGARSSTTALALARPAGAPDRLARMVGEGQRNLPQSPAHGPHRAQLAALGAAGHGTDG